MRWFAPALLLVLAACSGGSPAPKPAHEAPPPAELETGDLHLRAVAVPTLQLPESVARGYGIARGQHRVLLLVALRRGPQGAERGATARVQASATDLQGHALAIPMRELRTGDLVDYVGVLEITPPDTLRFQVDVIAEGQAPMHLDFAREFYP